MHEVSLAGGVLRLVEQSAQSERFARLLTLRLAAGQLSSVDVHALRFALESLAPGTLLEGAEIIIEEPPGQAWCMKCEKTVEIAQRIDPCPSCGGHQIHPCGGTELQVIEMQVSDT